VVIRLPSTFFKQGVGPRAGRAGGGCGYRWRRRWRSAAAGDLDDVTHARDRLGPGRVEAGDLAAEHGGLGDDGVEPSFELDVEAIDRVAADDVCVGPAPYTGADDAVVPGVLELWGGRRESGGRLDQFAVGGLLVGGRGVSGSKLTVWLRPLTTMCC